MNLAKFKKSALLVQAVLNTDPISNEEGLKNFNNDWVKASPLERAQIMSDFFEGIALAQAGQEPKSERVQKNLQALGNFPAQRIGDYMSFANELTQDLKWMAAFTVATATASSLDIVDFASFVTVNELGPSEKIELSKLGEEHIANMREKRFGTGIPILQRWLETNGVYTINTAITAMREAFITKQGNFAYALLAATAGVSTQTSAGSTIADITLALNTATDALIAANANKGFNISPDVPILFYLRHKHKGAFDQVMRQQEVTSTHPDYTDLRLTNMVVPVYTYNTNFPEQFGGKNAGMLVLPNRKNIWANFKGLAMNQESDFSTSSLVVEALQYWNAQAPAAQRYIVNLTA